MLLAYHSDGVKIRLLRCKNQGLTIASHMPRNCTAYVKRLRGICQPITRHMSNDENDAVLAHSLLGSSAEIALAHISCGFEVVRDTDECYNG